MACTGCTPVQAWSEWDLPSATRQLDYWHRHPAPHRLIAAYLDYKPAARSTAATPQGASQQVSESVAQSLIAMAPELPEHLKPKLPYRSKPHG